MSTTSLGNIRDRSVSLYVVLVGAVVALVPWFSQPRRIVADTKLDLTVDPWGYLARSQSAWDSHAFFGQLQNQAYGYLFPMGPFFGAGHSIGVPPWVVQRAWWTVVLLTAFVGMYLLVRRLDLAGPRGATVAAIAFALSPHALTVLGPISIEQWPSAMVPWIILASRRLAATHGRSRVGAAAVVALVCATVGGVNATASLAAFGVAGLFMLTGAADRRMFPLWCGAVIAGTAWWSIPLVALGRYAYPFLDFIETSAITTSVTSVPNVLRGMSHWVAFVANGQAGAEWPAGADLAAIRSLVVATTLVGVVGVVAVTWRAAWAGAPHAHRFAVVSMIVGSTVMVAGFGANLGLPFTGVAAGEVRDLLDGPAAALRNVHKFDPLVRLPLCLGIAVLVQRWAVDRRQWSTAVVVAVVAATAWPAVSSSVAPRGGYSAIPQRWVLAAERVDALAARQGGSTLLAPATRFGDFEWGNAQDDPLEALADSPVVTRDAIPLGNPGAIRIMDALDGTLRSGAARPGLPDLLARLGIGRVLVAHDSTQDAVDRTLDPDAVGADQRTEQTLRSSGLGLVQVWGKDDKRMSLWSTGRTVDRAELIAADSLTTLTGGPEALVDLSGLGLVGPRSPGYVFGDAAPPGSRSAVVQTDTLRKRSLDVASTIGNQYSPTLTTRESRGRRDFPPAGELAPTTRIFRGITVSSTASDDDGIGFQDAAIGAAGAFDADDDTVWFADAKDEDPRLSFTVDSGGPVGRVTVRLADAVNAGSVEKVDLVVDGTVMSKSVADQSEPLFFDVDRPVDRMEVRLTAARVVPPVPVGIATIALEGVDAAAALRLPEIAPGKTSAVVVSRDPWATSTPEGRRDDSRILDRAFTTSDRLSVDQVLLRTRTTPQVERLLDGWKVAGPRVDDDVRTRPGAALDQDPDTRWTVGFEAPDPTLTVDFGRSRTLSGLQLQRVGKKEPTIRRVRIRDLDTGEQREWNRADPEFTAFTARRISLTFDLPSRVVFPVRMPDVTLTGATDAPAANPGSLVEVPCTQGASVQTSTGGGGAAAPTGFTARVTRADLLDGAVLRGTSCGTPPEVPAGSVRLVGTSSNVFDVWSVAAGDVPQTSAAAAPVVRTWSDRQRHLDVVSGVTDQVVVWHEGYNDGWRATLGGVDLRPVQIDGWRQGFIVPAGKAGLIEASFAPDTAYRGGLLAGGVLVLLAAIAAFAWGRQPAPEPALESEAPRRAIRRTATIALTAVAFALMGGVGGLVLALLARIVPSRLRLRVSVGVGIALVVAVAWWPALVDDSWSTALTQALGLLLLALAAAALADPVDPIQDGLLDEAPRQVRHQD